MVNLPRTGFPISCTGTRNLKQTINHKTITMSSTTQICTEILSGVITTSLLFFLLLQNEYQLVQPKEGERMS